MSSQLSCSSALNDIWRSKECGVGIRAQSLFFRDLFLSLAQGNAHCPVRMLRRGSVVYGAFNDLLECSPVMSLKNVCGETREEALGYKLDLAEVSIADTFMRIVAPYAVQMITRRNHETLIIVTNTLGICLVQSSTTCRFHPIASTYCSNESNEDQVQA